MTELDLFFKSAPPSNDRLHELEVVIERGLASFVEVGEALLEIRDTPDLLPARYASFEHYCRERWGLEQRQSYRLMSASKVVANLTDCPMGQVPSNERQVRPLTALPPSDQIAVWTEAVERAPNGIVTAAIVEQVIEERGFDYKRDSKAMRTADAGTPQTFDTCQTPPYALDPILPYLSREWTIWEPARGEGLLVGGLYDAGFNQAQVIGTDILYGTNFLNPVEIQFDAIVTNPPFSLKFPWMRRCYELGRPFALLLPVETLGARTAQEMMQEYGFEIMLLNRRVNFHMPNKGWEGGGAQFPVFWLCWQLLPEKVMFGHITTEGYTYGKDRPDEG